MTREQFSLDFDNEWRKKIEESAKKEQLEPKDEQDVLEAHDDWSKSKEADTPRYYREREGNALESAYDAARETADQYPLKPKTEQDVLEEHEEWLTSEEAQKPRYNDGLPGPNRFSLPDDLGKSYPEERGEGG